MSVGDIYYFCDQYGAKFIKIKQISDIWVKDDPWVCVYSSAWLNHVVNAGDKNILHGCSTSQNKKTHFDKIVNSSSFKKTFIGAIKIPDYLIKSIIDNKEIEVDLPYIQTQTHMRFLCKQISKEDYRNMKLSLILED